MDEGLTIIRYYTLSHMTGLVFKGRVLLVITGLANILKIFAFLKSTGRLYQVCYAICFLSFLYFSVAKTHPHAESFDLYDITLFI